MISSINVYMLFNMLMVRLLYIYIYIYIYRLLRIPKDSLAFISHVIFTLMNRFHTMSLFQPHSPGQLQWRRQVFS